jgi:peptidoglycan hydrolase-like protein with peptidoglycan-binding domain
MSGRTWGTRRLSRRGVVVAGATTVVAAVAGGGIASSRRGADGAAHASPATAATGTARVSRTDLRTARQFDGTLGYGPPTTLVALAAGRAYTRLPAPGAVIGQGQIVYEVDGAGLPLLYGDRPAWRTLAAGVPPGPDVAQLNTALVALGYAHGVAGSTRFTAETRAAVRRWQRARGVAVTGTVDPASVVFAPGPLRVQTVHALLGASPRPGEPLLDVTATARVVDLPVPVDQAYLVHPHDPVVVTLPDGKARTAGRVSAISPVAVQPTADANPGRPAAPVVDVTVALDDPAAAATYTSAPITVAITTAEARGVLAVPVAALHARPDGSYAVTVVDGSTRREVPVTTGLFADTLVEVSGPGVREGSIVEVPAS